MKDVTYYSFTNDILHSLQYIPLTGTLVPGSNHFPLLQFYLQHPYYDHYWYIEDDVRFSGDWDYFFSFISALTPAADFSSCHIRTYEEEPKWCWWNTLRHEHLYIPYNLRIRSFNPIFRISNAAIQFIDHLLRHRWRGHHEVLIPTVLHLEGFKIMDFGGTGRFVRPGLQNKFYTSDEPNIYGDLYNGTMRVNPFEEVIGPPDNKLYHPVKPLRNRDSFTTKEPGKKVLIFFGSKGYEQSKLRLQASAVNYFDQVIAYNEEDIDPEFYNAHIKIFQHQRGWGYWLWKPYFIHRTLQDLDADDFCFYVDATSVFIADPARLFTMCRQHNGILLFDNFHFRNFAWTKADCFNLMQLTTDEYTYGKQVNAAFQLYQKNEQSLAFTEELLFYSRNYHIISDAPNITGENFPGFKDHRHDQSILSLLAIKHRISLATSPWQYSHTRIIDLKRDVKLMSK